MEAFSADNLLNVTQPDNLRADLHLGSTGRPKGARAMPMSAVCSAPPPMSLPLVRVMCGRCSIPMPDFSVWELFGALCTGGRLVIVPYQSRAAGVPSVALR